MPSCAGRLRCDSKIFVLTAPGQSTETPILLAARSRTIPSANPSTRQVEVLVAFSGDKRPQLAGLYAEGRIETGSRSALMIPAMSVVREGDKAFAWKVSAGQLRKVAIELGERDPRSGQIVLRAGLGDGDQLIRNPTSALSDGQPLQLQPAAPKSGASAGGN